MADVEVDIVGQKLILDGDDLPQGPQGVQGPAGQGVPTGGTTGQVLTKISSTNYDTAWVTPSGGTSVSDTFVDIRSYGVVGDDYSDTAKIQAAFNNVPEGSIINFPPMFLKTNAPINVSRYVGYNMGRATMRGDLTTGQSVINYSAAPPGDKRQLVLRGGIVYTITGDVALNINPLGTNEQPHFETEICNGQYGGSKKGIRIGGATAAGDTNFCTVRQCTVETYSSTSAVAGVDLDGCADGHRVLDSHIFGYGASVRVNVVEGAYNTAIVGNCLTARDGAMHMLNGAKGIFHRNQCEQHGGTNTLGAHVKMVGQNYIAHSWSIKENNFGAGSNVTRSIHFQNAQGNVAEDNYFFPGATDDIYFDSAAKYNTIGRNWCRGTRSQRNALTDSSRRMNISMHASAVGNRGIWRGDITLANSWVKSDFEFFVDDAGFLHLEGALDGGTTTSNTLIGTMPVGCRPRKFATLLYPTETGTFGYVTFNTAGEIRIINSPASPNQRIELSHMILPVDWLNAYDIGAV